MKRPDSDDQSPGRGGAGRVGSAPPYELHLTATAGWLERSIEHGKGGSCAYYSPLLGWSRPYPETTGYLIPTLIDLSRALSAFEGEERAIALGTWLLGIQRSDGSWAGGVHPPKDEPRPSVFNTAQILRGLVALFELTAEDRWLDAAIRGARWLADGIGPDGLWTAKDYRAAGTPSYYTYAASPMLLVAARSDDTKTRDVAERVLQAILARRRPNGTFSRWAFSDNEAAFTHTVAYTLQGLVESARLLDDWALYGQPAERALGELVQLSGSFQGRVPGRLDDDWAPAAGYVCLTGNAQIALCLLDLHEKQPDPRLPAAVTSLVDVVCSAQRLRTSVAGIRGAVAGSSPVWGRYMTLRYPNWAAKYVCDLLVRLSALPPRATER